MYSHLGLDEGSAHPAFPLASSIWWVAAVRLSLPIGEISLSRLRPCPSAESQLLPNQQGGEQGRPGWWAGRRHPPVAMALSPPISAHIAASPGQGVWLHGGSGWLSGVGCENGQLETWKPEPPDLATSPDPPSSQGTPFSSSSGGVSDLREA